MISKSGYGWLLVVSIWIVAFILGYVGFSNYHSSIGEPRPVWDNMYLSLQLFVLQSGGVPGSVGPELQVARFLAPVIAIYTALLALTLVLHEQIILFRSRFLKDHIVICGLGRKGTLLANSFREQGERVVVIEQDDNNDMIGECKEHGSIVLIGNVADPYTLRRARVQRAKYLISVCGDDGINAEVAVNARILVANRTGRALSCLIHIVDLQLCDLLRERGVKMGRSGTFRLEFFNVYESGARVLLDEHQPFDGTAVDGDRAPHVVVVGIGSMGESVAVNAARRWWDAGNKDGKRIRITLVDREAEDKGQSLLMRYPQMGQTCELIPLQVDINSPSFEQVKFLFDKSENCDVNIIYVCLDGDSCALSSALILHRRIRAHNVPIVVRMHNDAGLATLLRAEDGIDSYSNIHAFALLDRTCTPQLLFGGTFETLARAFHEDYVRNESAKGLTPLENPSMVPWEELPEHLRDSNREAAANIRTKLDAISCDITVTGGWDVHPFEFSPEELELMARMEHERWAEEKLREGWRYGPTRDDARKAHPSLVPWSELSEEEKDKDRNPVRGLPEFLAKARFQIYRLQ